MSACRPAAFRPRRRNGCTTTHSGARFLNSHEAIVEAYQAEWAPIAAEERQFYGQQRDLSSSIEVSAMSRDPENRRHPHQRRFKKQTLRKAADRLHNVQSNLSQCETFDDLFNVVYGTLAPIKGIGCKSNGVTPYDIADRIGLYLGLEPERVYAHAGTADGARALGLRGKVIEVDQFPPAFRELTPHQIEDCLCLYKKALWALVRQAQSESPQVPKPLRVAAG